MVRRLTWSALSLVAVVLIPLAWANDPPAVESAPAKTDEPVAGDDADQTAKSSEDQFLRIRRDSEGKPLALETAIVRYVPVSGDGPTVDLIGAVHIGEETYYRALNKRFEGYDALLYELVARKGDAVPDLRKKSRMPSAIGSMQKMMQNMLGLSYQLEGIDYSAKNFVHADMSPEEFAQSMKERNESFLKMYFRMMGYSAARSAIDNGGGTSDVDMLSALFDDDRDWKLKRMMAEQMGDLDSQSGALEGSNGSTILTERNKKALEVLKTTLDEGSKKSIGIFYGAAHLPDFEERLLREFGMKRAGTEWMVAWALEPEVLAEAEKADLAPAKDETKTEAPQSSKRKAAEPKVDEKAAESATADDGK